MNYSHGGDPTTLAGFPIGFEYRLAGPEIDILEERGEKRETLYLFNCMHYAYWEHIMGQIFLITMIVLYGGREVMNHVYSHRWIWIHLEGDCIFLFAP